MTISAPIPLNRSAIDWAKRCSSSTWARCFGMAFSTGTRTRGTTSCSGMGASPCSITDLRLAALTRAVHADDRNALHAALVDVGFVKSGQAYDFDTARRLVRSFYGPMLRDEELRIEVGEARPFGAVLQSKRELLQLRLPGEFLFILRIRFGVMSVLARLGARANWYRLERRFSEE
jgi:hypothetical protein